MSKSKVILLKVSFLGTVFCLMQASFAQTNIDYNSVNLESLQNQYQRQLNPKKAPASAPKRTSKSGQIQRNELLQYQRLLQNQQTTARPKPQPQKQAIRQTQKYVKPTQARPRLIAIPKPKQAPAPRRDAIFEAASSGNVNLIRQLLSQGVNVNQANNERETALHMAAAKGHYSVVIFLINHGANINARTINNWLPIHHATRFRHAQIANYLKQRGSPIYAKTTDGLSAVDMARAINDRRILGIFGVR